MMYEEEEDIKDPAKIMFEVNKMMASAAPFKDASTQTDSLFCNFPCSRCKLSSESGEEVDCNREWSDHFWRKLENGLNTSFPTYLKNILTVQTFANPYSFKCLDEKTIDEIEKFVRDDLYLLLSEDEMSNFYGRFHKTPRNFKFMAGDKILIEDAVKYVVSTKPQYWKKQEDKVVPSKDTSSEQSNIKLENIPSVEFEEEKKKCLDAIVTFTKNQNENLEDELKRKLTQETVIEISTLPDPEYPLTKFRYAAHITCPECSVTLNIKKTVIPNSPGKWTLSNFTRHAMQHSKIGKGKSKRK